MKKVNEKLTEYYDNYDNQFLYDPEEILKQDSYDAGLEKGLKEGKTLGIEEGKRQNKINVAKNMIEIGITKDKIKKVTGLSLEEIDKL